MRSKGDVSGVFLAIRFRMASAFCFYLVGSKGNVSAFFWLQCVPSGTFRTFCYLSVVRSKGDVSGVFVAFCYRFQSCWGSAFSHVLRRLRYGFLSVYCGLFLSLEGSVGNVSRVFCLRFRSVFGPFWARI